MSLEPKVIARIPSSIRISKLLDYWLAPTILLIIDYVTIIFALLTTYIIRNDVIPSFFSRAPQFSLPTSYLYFVIPFIYIVLILYERLITKRLPFWQSEEKLFKICLYATILAIGVIFFIGNAKEISRLFVAINGFITFCYLSFAHYFAKKILLALGLWQNPVIVVGAGKTAEILVTAFEDNPDLGYRIIGVIEDNHLGKPLIHKYKLLGSFSNIEQIITTSSIQDVVIAAPGLKREKLVELVNRIQPLVKNVSIIPDLVGIPVSNMEVNTLFNQKVFLLTMKNNFSQLFNRILKRGIDLFLGVIALFMTAPFMIVIMIMIKLDSDGPFLHVAKRLGKGGREFKCYKFRTMFANNDEILKDYLSSHPLAKIEWDRFAKLREYDPRVTQVGKWLRKFSLDELPQIFNVLIGNMSLVGPRPYLPRELERMGYNANIILEVVPGITGLWQVSGRNEIEFDGRLSLDTWYVRNWSPWLDFVMMFKTFEVVLVRKGAY